MSVHIYMHVNVLVGVEFFKSKYFLATSRQNNLIEKYPHLNQYRIQYNSIHKES